MTSGHINKLLRKESIPKPASHTILHWEALKFMNVLGDREKWLFDKANHALYRRYKCYCLFLRLRQWKLTDQASSLMQAHYASKPRNPE